MALKITREADAKRLLLPEGWAWTNDVGPTPTGAGGTWDWGGLSLKPDYRVNPKAAIAYKALVEIILKYEVAFRNQQWGRANPRLLTCIWLRPFSKAGIDSLALDYGTTPEDALRIYREQQGGGNLNLFGWTMADGTVMPPGEYLKDGNFVCCAACKCAKIDLITDPNSPNNHYCRRCVRVCPGNGTDSCNIPIFDALSHGCPDHFPRANCAGCGVEGEVAYFVDSRGSLYCTKCFRSICARCNKLGAVVETDVPLKDGEERWLVCSKCKPAVSAWLKQDRNEAIILEKPLVPHLEHSVKRPVRLASVEMEVSSGATVLLAALREKKLTRAEALATHWRGDDTDFCYMEKDSSLPDNGGELIFSKMRLNHEPTAEKFGEAIGVVRKLAKAGIVSVDLATGLHIHVDAHKLGFNHIRNLVAIFNYLEDPIYRLSAANYTRHRGTFFAMMLPKGGIESQADFNQHFFQNNEHHSVLNVAYYLQAVGRCKCGGIVGGTPELCECALGKCTVEFRSFNGTSSWKKIHSYLALCMSMVAWAERAADVDINDFPPCFYNAVGEIDSTLKSEWKERLAWMFENLWFTSEERASLNYCIEHSELNKLSYADRAAIRATNFSSKKYVPTKPPKKATQKDVPRKIPQSLAAQLGANVRWHEDNGITINQTATDFWGLLAPPTTRRGR